MWSEFSELIPAYSFFLTLQLCSFYFCFTQSPQFSLSPQSNCDDTSFFHSFLSKKLCFTSNMHSFISSKFFKRVLYLCFDAWMLSIFHLYIIYIVIELVFSPFADSGNMQNKEENYFSPSLSEYDIPLYLNFYYILTLDSWKFATRNFTYVINCHPLCYAYKLCMY